MQDRTFYSWLKEWFKEISKIRFKSWKIVLWGISVILSPFLIALFTSYLSLLSIVLSILWGVDFFFIFLYAIYKTDDWYGW
jgi:hypothetical protein